MDLEARSRTEKLNKIMADNGIVVPRLRGLRLMSDEEPISSKTIEIITKETWGCECEDAVRSHFRYGVSWCEYSHATDKLVNKYLIKNGYYVDGIRWDKVHGKRRKLFKYLIKTATKKVRNNFMTFNKYCGRDDVLCIYARVGGGNWPNYRKEIETQPWFIEKADYPYDSTYCDIYARINPIAKELKGEN